MELKKEIIQKNQVIQQITHQFYVDEDVNVPDVHEDVSNIMHTEGNLSITNLVKVEQYLKVTGILSYQLLYATENEEQPISCMEGKIPVEELVYIDNMEECDYRVNCNQLEYQAFSIHSRKVNVKAMVELQVKSICTQQEEISTDIESEMQVMKKQRTMPVLQLFSSKKDTYRIKEEIKIPGTKENIGQMLMSKIGSYKLETRAGQDEIILHGEFQFFAMYLSDEWKEDWVSQTISYDGRVECYGIDETMYHHIHSYIDELSVEPHMDEDGEVRILGIEATLKMDITAYKEENVEILEDIYTLEEHCCLKKKMIPLESLVLQNQSKCKIVESLALPELKNDLFQICDSSGRVQVERVEKVEQGLVVEGILHINFLYIKGNDAAPYGSWKGMVPFTHLIECPLEGETNYDIDSSLEQISVTMAGNDEVEIKGILNLHCFIRSAEMVQVIEAVELQPFSKEELNSQAGIIGYIYKSGDNLWDLAKKYHTTVEGILEINNIEKKDLCIGRKLLIFKENLSIL